MKTAANTTRLKRMIRSVVLCSLFGMILAGMTGCEFKDGKSEEDICAFMENVAQATEKCLEERNITLARDTWSDLSEQGMNATDQGAEEIGQAVSRLAGTYSDLVVYCQTGNDEDRETFLKNFQREAEKLSEQIAQEGFDTAKLNERVEEVCAK